MLRLSQSQLDAVCKHGEETYPHECCGVLLGRSAGGGETRWVKKVVRCGNTRQDSPQSRYHIDPKELVRIQREGREQELDIVGFYHSHPDHPAQWSKTDLEEAHWMGCSYVITSVEKGAARDTNTFLLDGRDEESKQFRDERLVVEDND